MKIQSNRLLCRSVLALMGLAAAWPSAHATLLYWDSNDVTPGAGAAPYGTWGVNAFWNTDAAGGAGTFATTTTSDDDLQFVAGPTGGSGDTAYTVTVDSPQSAKSLTFLNPASPTLTGGILSVGAGGISVPQMVTSAVVAGSAVSGTKIYTLDTAVLGLVNATVSGTGIPVGTTVTSVTGTPAVTLNLSNFTTATVTNATFTPVNANRVTFNSTLNLTANQTWAFNNNSGNAYIHFACDFTGSGNITQTGIGGNRIYAGSSAGWTGALTLNGSGLTFGTSQQAQTRLNHTTLTMRNAGTSNPSMTIYLDNGGVTNFPNNIVFDNAGGAGWNFNQNNGSGSVGAVEVLSGTLSGTTNGQVLFSGGNGSDLSGLGLHGQIRLSGNNSGWTSTRGDDAVWIRTGYLYLDHANALGASNSISM
ncbi:MAG: hypothetical protein WCP45_17555, partial [Verrucomicrobiota bacterium]